MTVTAGSSSDVGVGIGAFPEPPRREHHSHNPMSELFSYDAFSARAQAFKEILNGVYTFSEARDEARRCADEANRIAEHYQWPTVDPDEGILPSQILDALPAPPTDHDPAATFGRDMSAPAGESTRVEDRKGGRHRRDDSDGAAGSSWTPAPDTGSTSVVLGAVQAPRSMGDTQVIRAVSPLAG